MNPAEQKQRGDAVRKLEASHARSVEDFTLLLEAHLRQQAKTHLHFVNQHEMQMQRQDRRIEDIAKQATTQIAEAKLHAQEDLTQAAQAMRADYMDETEPLRRGFFGRVKWALTGK